MNYEIKFLKDAYKLQKTSPLSIKLGLVFLFHCRLTMDVCGKGWIYIFWNMCYVYYDSESMN